MKAKILGIVLAGFLVACGSDDDDDGLAGQIIPDQQVAADLDGEYSLSVVATVDFASDGGTCSDATGNITLTDGVVSGTAITDDNGTVFDITGSVADDGALSGGFATSGQTIVTFEGSIDGATGSGDWVDEFDCMGTWEAALMP